MKLNIHLSPDAADSTSAQPEDQKKIAGLLKQVESLSGKLSDAQSTIQTLKKENKSNEQAFNYLAQENTQLKATVSKLEEEVNLLKSRQTQASADEVVIREKMVHGLTRDQAISVIKRQRAHEEHEKAQAEKAEAAKAEKK